MALSLAIQACETATANISRPSSPQERNEHVIPEKESEVRLKLDDFADQSQMHIGNLKELVQGFQHLAQEYLRLVTWINDQKRFLTECDQKPNKLNSEMSKKDFRVLNDLINEIQMKRNHVMTVDFYRNFANDNNDSLENLFDNIEECVQNVLLNKSDKQKYIDTFNMCVQNIYKW